MPPCIFFKINYNMKMLLYAIEFSSKICYIKIERQNISVKGNFNDKFAQKDEAFVVYYAFRSVFFVYGNCCGNGDGV